MCLPRAAGVAVIGGVLAGGWVVSSGHLDAVLITGLVTASAVCVALMVTIIHVMVRDHSFENIRRHQHEHWWHRRHQHEHDEEDEHLAEVIPFRRVS